MLRDPIRQRLCGRFAAVLGVLLFASLPARGEVLLQGDAAAVRLDVTEATVDEILVALNRDYGLRYRTTIALDRHLSGTYTGPLPRVLARILEGYDYVARVTSDGVDIPYIRTRGSAAPAASSVTVNRVILPMSVGQLTR